MHPSCRFASLALVVATVAVAPVAAASLWDDRNLRIIQTRDLNFPPNLLLQGITEGEVDAVLNIDGDGTFRDCLVTAYTHLELAREVLLGVREWDYEPAYHRGKPTGARLAVRFQFQARGMVMSLTPIDSIVGPGRRMLGQPPVVLICKPSELDHPLTALATSMPGHPGKSLRPAQTTGKVSVDFYIDAEGRPRMPVVTRATHEAFAIAAVEALLQWKFAAPLHRGRPVAVRVVQEFVFSDETKPTT